VGKVGFEPTKILIARFTVWCTSPSVPLTRKYIYVAEDVGVEPTLAGLEPAVLP
jgi:hypothetical protein